MSKDTILQAKKELESELKELEVLENKVKTKKDSLKYEKLQVPFKVGDAYYIRTVTYHMTGRVKAIETHFACDEMLKKYGGKTVGCCCTGHNCKVVRGR